MWYEAENITGNDRDSVEKFQFDKVSRDLKKITAENYLKYFSNFQINLGKNEKTVLIDFPWMPEKITIFFLLLPNFYSAISFQCSHQN